MKSTRGESHDVKGEESSIVKIDFGQIMMTNVKYMTSLKRNLILEGAIVDIYNCSILPNFPLCFYQYGRKKSLLQCFEIIFNEQYCDRQIILHIFSIEDLIKRKHDNWSLEINSYHQTCKTCLTRRQ